jgi:hypothetical protein
VTCLGDDTALIEAIVIAVCRIDAPGQNASKHNAAELKRMAMLDQSLRYVWARFARAHRSAKRRSKSFQ